MKLNGTTILWAGTETATSSAGDTVWTIGGLSGLTATPGEYVITLGSAPAQYTFRWRSFAGTSGNDTIGLTVAPGSTTDVRVTVNGTAAGTFNASTTDQIVIDAAGGNDVLTDAIPAPLRPAAGTFLLGGSGTDAVSLAGTDDDDAISVAADGSVGIVTSGSTWGGAAGGPLRTAGIEGLTINGADGDDAIDNRPPMRIGAWDATMRRAA